MESSEVLQKLKFQISTINAFQALGCRLQRCVLACRIWTQGPGAAGRWSPTPASTCTSARGSRGPSSSPPGTPGRRPTRACPATIERAACRRFRVHKKPSTRITKCLFRNQKPRIFLTVSEFSYNLSKYQDSTSRHAKKMDEIISYD